MKTETILNALERAFMASYDFREMGNWKTRRRQYRAFRDRIIRLDERSKMKTYTLEGKIAELEGELENYKGALR